MTQTRTAIFPGSFDPPTNGHVDIVERALELFDTVIVGILSHPEKKALFTTKERVNLLEKSFKKYKGRVSVEEFSGLLAEFAKRKKSRVIIRGLRAITDFDYESQMALMNRRLSGGVETVFLVAREENSYISSSVVKQVAKLGGKVTAFVPKHVVNALRAKLSKRKG